MTKLNIFCLLLFVRVTVLTVTSCVIHSFYNAFKCSLFEFIIISLSGLDDMVLI